MKEVEENLMKGRKRNRCAPGNAICPIHRLPAHIPSGDLFGVVIPLRCITGPGDGFRHPYTLMAEDAKLNATAKERLANPVMKTRLSDNRFTKNGVRYTFQGKYTNARRIVD